MAFNADGKRFVTSSFDGLCRVWDTLNGQCCTTIVSPSMGSRGVPAVSAARFSPNGEYLLLSTLDSAVRLWDVGAGKCVKTYVGHVNKGYCAFSTFFSMDGTGGQGHQHASIVSGSGVGRSTCGCSLGSPTTGLPAIMTWFLLWTHVSLPIRHPVHGKDPLLV